MITVAIFVWFRIYYSWFAYRTYSLVQRVSSRHQTPSILPKNLLRPGLHPELVTHPKSVCHFSFFVRIPYLYSTRFGPRLPPTPIVARGTPTCQLRFRSSSCPKLIFLISTFVVFDLNSGIKPPRTNGVLNQS